MNTSILYHLLTKYSEKELNGNTIYNIDFSHLDFLHSKEGTLLPKGVKAAKSYYYDNFEVARIEYNKLIKDHTHNGKVYNNIFVGTQMKITYFDYHGKIAGSKTRKPYYFSLTPSSKDNAIVGFTSSKMRKILAEERKEADYFLQSKNPELYATLYNYYANDYEYYLRTGDKSKLVTALNNETRTEIKAYLDKTVEGLSITIKELILNNLQ